MMVAICARVAAPLGGQLAVYAVHQLLFHGPGHGDLGVLADGFGVGITGQVALGAHVLLLVLGVPVQEGHQAAPG